jgi:parvulin-like peptidyl-prolyl isomerase
VRRPLLFSLFAVLAVFVAACGSSVADKPLGSAPAATVNGVEISEDELMAEVELRAEADSVLSQASSTAQPATYSTEQIAQVLNDLIITILLEQHLEKEGIEVTAEHEAQARDQLIQQFAVADPTTGEPVAGTGEDQLAAIPEGLADQAIAATAGSIALMEVLAPVTDEDLMASYEENKELLATPCVSHILISTEEREPAEAQQIAANIKAQLDGGADFAELARTSSDDPGSSEQGGELGCNPGGSFVPEFEEAVFAQPVGEVGDPVATEFGFHLILVTGREVPTFEDSRDQLEGALAQQGQQALQDWVATALAEADVEVDPRYGTWDPEQGGVVPPEGPAAPSTTIPALEQLPGGELPLEELPQGQGPVEELPVEELPTETAPPGE